MNRGQKKTRITASARAGYRCLGVFRLRCFCCRFTSACQQVLCMQRRKMCGILTHMPCGDGDLASPDVEDVSHGRTPRHACRLRTPSACHSTHLVLASISASTHANRRLCRPRVAGANKLQIDSPGHCCGRTPTVDESRAKENPQQCVCTERATAILEVVRLRRFLLPIRFCLSIVFLEKKLSERSKRHDWPPREGVVDSLLSYKHIFFRCERPRPIALSSEISHARVSAKNPTKVFLHARTDVEERTRKPHLHTHMPWKDPSKGHITRCERSFYLVWSHELPIPMLSMSNLFLLCDRRVNNVDGKVPRTAKKNRKREL